MSISGLHMGTRAIQAHQIALEITGQNISNVNTEGYTRQRASLAQTIPLDYSYGTVGTGVKVDGIERIRDAFVDLEIRNQTSDLGSDSVQADMYDRIEKILNDPSEEGLDTRLGDFFDSIYDVVNAPEETGLKNTTIIEAQALAQQIQFVNGELDQLRIDLNSAVVNGVDEINSLTQQIADLNKKIVKVEAGGNNQANDFRDQRDQLLKDLSEWTNITTNEMDTGEVNVSIGGQSIIFGSTVTTLETELQPGDELPLQRVIVSGSGSPVNFDGGKMQGYMTARDTNIPKYIDRLDTLARGLIDQINKQHTQGLGTRGFSTVTSENAVSDSSAALDSSGAHLDITPVDSTFNLIVSDKSGSSCVETTLNISVDVSSDSLDDVATSINNALSGAGISEISAAVTSENKLELTSSDDDFTYYLQDTTDDTNNVLSSLGLNTFFKGTDASNIGVNSFLAENPQFLAAAQSTAQGDNTNALAMADIRKEQVMDSGTKTLEQYYQTALVDLGADSRESQTQTDAGKSFLTELELKRESISGVNLDEEAANLIIFQRAYEASARYISVCDSLLNTLVNGLI